jgi:hypothetical protein
MVEEKAKQKNIMKRLRSKVLLSDFLFGFYFDLEDGGNVFRRNVC